MSRQSAKRKRRHVLAAIEPLERRCLLSVGVQPAGPLSGHVLFTSGGHGIVWRNTGSWTYMRPLLLNMIEDLGNQDQLEFYGRYVLNAGGTFVRSEERRVGKEGRR